MVRVNDTTFTMGYYLERLRILNKSKQLAGESADLAVEPFRLLQTLQEDELIRQSAGRYNVSVTAEEVNNVIRENVQPPAEEKEKLSQDELQSDFNARYRQRLNDLSVSDKEYRKLITAQLLREKLKDKLNDRVPSVAEQVHTLGVFVENYEDALQVKKQLDEGANFATVARRQSKDDESSKQDGDMGWLPKGVMGPQFDEVAFALPTSRISEPIVLPKGVWIIKALDRAEARQVEGKARELLRNKAVEDWFQEESKANKVEQYWDSHKYELVVQKLREYRAPGQEPSRASG